MEQPKSIVKTAKPLGRWKYNYHKQVRRWFWKSKATAWHKNNTPMRDPCTGAATTMSCPVEVATLLYSSITEPYVSSAHSLKTKTRGETAKCSELSSHFNRSNWFGQLYIFTHSSCTNTCVTFAKKMQYSSYWAWTEIMYSLPQTQMRSLCLCVTKPKMVVQH